MNYWLILIPFISAFIGWLIHSIAINYLFHPYEPKKFAGIIFQGIVPRKKKHIAAKIGQIAAKEFGQFSGIEEKINDPKTLESIMPVIEKHIDIFLNEKLKQEIPVISMFIGNKTTDKLKEVFLKEIHSLFPQILGKFADNLKAEINIEQIVAQKINDLSPEELEKNLLSAMPGEFRALKILGAATGFIIGLLQLVILMVFT